MMKDNPTTVYIYPESRDIDAIARAGRGGSYWNASCLKEIGSPKFWPKEIPRADRCSIPAGSSGAAAADAANLQGALNP
jgi:hypothetical protein